MTSFGQKMHELLGRDSFARDGDDKIPTFARDEARRIVVFVSRQTVAPFINRSETPDETVTLTLQDGTEIIEVPARKFKSKEKLLGVRLCKVYKAIDPSYEYNDIKESKLMSNPVSVLFGDTVVESGRGNQAMLPSRVLYSSSYSIRDKVTLTKRLTHNALSELGTMWDRNESKFRQSLFETEYIIPGTIFPSFLVLKDPTPEMLYLLLRTLKETSYGAQTSITGTNFSNSIVAIMGAKVEPPISSFTVAEEVRSDLVRNGKDTKDISSPELSNIINSHVITQLDSYSTKFGGKVLHGSTLAEMLEIMNRLSNDETAEIFERLVTDSESLWKFAGFK
jgi:CRISPR-associated protein Csc2